MKITDDKIEQALKNADASLRMEGLYATEEEKELCRRSLKGEITHEEFVKEVLRRCGK
jgi:hypothetical protein